MAQPPSIKNTGNELRHWQAAVICLVLAGLVFAVFGQTASHQFVDFDDNAYVYENPVVAHGLTMKGLGWAFGVHAHNWHPLTWFSHMLDCQIYGLKPAGHHVTNVLLHAASAVCLFLLLRRMTGAQWRSAFVAAVFAVHPLRVESVAWVAERKDVLSGLFFLLTLLAYVRFTQLPASKGRYTLVLLLFVLGLMSKPMLVTLPVVLLLADSWPLRRKEPLPRLLLEKWPLFVLSLISCLVTIHAQTAAIQSADTYPLLLRLNNAAVSAVVYLAQMIYPANLAVIYPYPHAGLPMWEVALAVILIAAISAGAWTQRQKRPWLLVGWLWCLVMSLPTLGIVQAGNQAHADRYTYLPQIGIYLSITWLAAEWIRNRVVAETLMAAVVLTLAVAAWHQTQFWKNSETMWARALAVTKDNDMAHYGMGDVYLAKKNWPKAAAEFTEAARIKPAYPEAHNNLGLVLFNEGKIDKAMEQYEIALELNSDYADARFNLGNAYLHESQWTEAIENYHKTIVLEPERAVVHGNLGIALFSQGRKNEALDQFRLATDLAPDDPEAHYNLAEALRELGKPDQAIESYRRALQIKPNYAAASLELARLYVQTGKQADAVAQLRNVLKSEPDNPRALNSLAWIEATSKDAVIRNGAHALQLAQKASAQAEGKNPIYLRSFAAACAAMGKFDDAKTATTQAIAIVRAAKREDMARDLESDLTQYERKLPLRQ
jgi:tetratricopeptide (TPR) repeat protein